MLKKICFLIIIIINLRCSNNSGNIFPKKITSLSYTEFRTKDTIDIRGKELSLFLSHCKKIDGIYKFPATGFVTLYVNNKIVYDSIRTNNTIMGPIDSKYYTIMAIDKVCDNISEN